MNDRPVTIFISAAEASGDDHAAQLIRAIKARRPNARLIGVAGEQMAAEGCEVVADLTRKATMMGGPLLRLGYYMRMVRDLKETIARLRPDLMIPVDSPALNWHLADAAKKVGTPVGYYIAPQVWAWARWRVRKLARLTDAVACILPFEQAYLRRRGVNATYVGHPLLDSLPPRPDPMPDLLEAWSQGTWRVALLPGSRHGEIRRHARALQAASQAIRRRWPAAHCIFAARDERAAEVIRALCKDVEPEIVVGRTRDVLADAHFTIAASGTVIVEAAYFGTPMVVFYHVGRIQYAVARHWLQLTRDLSLVNILAGRRIVPEMMPWHGNIPALVAMVMDVMEDLGYLLEARESLLEIIEPLRSAPPHTASEHAAELLLGLLE